MDFQIGQIFGLLLRTLPFLALRVLVYLGIALGYAMATGIGAGFGYLFGKAGGNSAAGAFWGALAGFVVVSGVIYWLREYLLYLVKAGHIAVLVELIEGRDIPAGRGQIDYATGIVKSRFVESSSLFALDRLIHGILRVFNRITFSMASVLPIPGLNGLMKIINAIVNVSLTYLDEVILAQILRLRSNNPWATARDSVVLYAQNFKGVLKNALFLTLIVWALTFGIFLLVLGPVAAMVSFFPKLAGAWTVALAVVFALSLKAALIDPFAMVALMQVYFKLTTGQSPNAEWASRLNALSGKFRQLEQKAGEPVRAAAVS